MPRPIALLIPVFNDPEGLAASLDQLPGELPLDVVVVDDGSDPPIKPPSIAKPHRLFWLRLPENQGITKALNHGLAWVLERGYPYIARLDAGDIALPGRFLSQFAFLETHPRHALVGGQVALVNEKGEVLYQERYPCEHTKLVRCMHLRNCFIHSAVMLRASVFEELGLYHLGYPAAEDYELFFRITRNFYVANLPEVIVKVRLSSQGISSRLRKTQLLSRLKVQLRYFDPRFWESYLGVLGTAVLYALPRKGIIGWKRYWSKL